MYQINLPREFTNPPLYLLRSESKPKEMAKRLGLAMRPTLRQDIQIATRRVMGPRPVQMPAAPRAAGYVTQPGPSRLQQPRRIMGVQAKIAPAGATTEAEPGLPKRVASGPVPQPMAMPRQAITVTPSSSQGQRRTFRYAPEGGFMQSVWRSGVSALAVRPKGEVLFRPHPVVKARPRGGLI